MGKAKQVKKRRKTASRLTRTANQLPADALRKAIKARVSVLEANMLYALDVMRKLVGPGGILARFEVIQELTARLALGDTLESEELAALKEAIFDGEEPRGLERGNDGPGAVDEEPQPTQEEATVVPAE